MKIKKELKKSKKLEEKKIEEHRILKEKINDIKRLEESNKLKEKIQNAQFTTLLIYLKKNYIFYIAVLFCLYKFKQSKNNKSCYIQLIISFIQISLMGYFVHYISHHLNFTQYLNETDNILTRNQYSNFVLNKTAEFFDFHHKLHHDTLINKQIKYIIYEFLNNIFQQGLLIVILIKFIDIRVIILWAFMYASVHNINYLYFSPTTHAGHHKDYWTNYGIDLYDILLNSKFDWDDIESHNHAAINLIIITYIILYFT
jgi:hypothetical protein